MVQARRGLAPHGAARLLWAGALFSVLLDGNLDEGTHGIQLGSNI